MPPLINPHDVLNHLIKTLTESAEKAEREMVEGPDGTYTFRPARAVEAIFDGPPGIKLSLTLAVVNLPGEVVEGSEETETKAYGMDDLFVFNLMQAVRKLQDSGLPQETILGMLTR